MKLIKTFACFLSVLLFSTLLHITATWLGIPADNAKFAFFAAVLLGSVIVIPLVLTEEL